MVGLSRLQFHRLLLERLMPVATRTYWLTTPCRLRRQDQSLVVEREGGDRIHIPVTDVRDVVACAPVDLNTAVIALLNRHRINIHLLSHYGDYAGSVLTAGTSTSGETVLAQARLASDSVASMKIARDIVIAAAFNVRRVIDRQLLTGPYNMLKKSAAAASTSAQLMAAEGTFRRSAWELLDTKLPNWLRLSGRSRRPPRNAGNALISYVNGIVYARVLTAVRLTPLHTGIAFLHSTMERQRHSLVLDLAEVFKPMFAERLLLRLAARGQLREQHFNSGVEKAMLSDTGRRFVVQTVRDELATTVQHRSLRRRVAYDELLYLEALRLTRHCLEDATYRPFRIWW
jgi:CRISPR-associated protein Cas1